MILAEHQPPRSHQDVGSTISDNDIVATELGASVASSSTSAQDPSTCQQYQHPEEVRSVVSVDVHENLAHYQEAVGTLAVSEDDEGSSEPESSDSEGTSISDDGDELALPDRSPDERGWLDEIPQPQSDQHVQHVMNGVTLPNSTPPHIDKLVVHNPGNITVGNKAVYQGPVTIKQFIYAKSTSLTDGGDKTEDGSLDNGQHLGNHNEKNGGLVDEPKLSTGSSHPLYPFQHGKVAEWFWTRRCTVSICVVALVLITVTGLTIWLTSASDPTISGVRIVPRIEWGAQPPTKKPTPLQVKPPPFVIISHTATTFCFTQAQCVLNVRFAQTFHIESRGWEDIGYNFLVGGDGLVYEGRGWGIEGAHTFNYNIKSIGISFIGTFNTEAPTKAQVHAAKKLIEYGVEIGEISKDYTLLGHRQCAKTESPGEILYKIIKTWEHWKPVPEMSVGNETEIVKNDLRNNTTS